jgi:hypothetical protein
MIELNDTLIRLAHIIADTPPERRDRALVECRKVVRRLAQWRMPNPELWDWAELRAWDAVLEQAHEIACKRALAEIEAKGHA